MADTKISALTAATTPLAGTEVLPIVQSGVTKKVSVANLTAGRAVSMLSATSVGANTYNVINNTGAPGSNASPSFAGTQFLGYAGALKAQTDGGDCSSSSFRGVYRVQTCDDGSQNMVTRMQFNGSSDITWFTVNLVQGTAAKGINFTANTAMSGSTSRLLNWYEEGVFTATVSPSTSGTVTLNSSYNLLAYTRVGRMVTIQGQLIVSSVSSPVGFFYVNFPFAISSGLAENAGWVTGSVVVAGGTSAPITGFSLLGSPGESAVRVYLGTGTTFSATSAAQLQANASITISLSFII